MTRKNFKRTAGHSTFVRERHGAVVDSRFARDEVEAVYAIKAQRARLRRQQVQAVAQAKKVPVTLPKAPWEMRE